MKKLRSFLINLHERFYFYLKFLYFVDCEDDDDSCEHWESIGYCQTSSKYYSFMSQKCPKSCRLCKACPTPEPPNRDLPPTPQSCSESMQQFNFKPTLFLKQSSHKIYPCALLHQ